MKFHIAILSLLNRGFFCSFFCAVLCGILDVSTLQAADSGFQVVVNPSNPVAEIDQKYLAEIFLKKKIYWPDSQVITVVDLDSSSDVRRLFSEQVLYRPVSAVRNYWQQILFSGRGIPPAEFKNEQDVLSFVATHEEAIGYVSNHADLKNLKAITIR